MLSRTIENIIDDIYAEMIAINERRLRRAIRRATRKQPNILNAIDVDKNSKEGYKSLKKMR